MKKRVLSMLLALILCFSTLPMTAFAQEAVQEADVVTEQADPAAEQEEAEAAVSYTHLDVYKRQTLIFPKRELPPWEV